MDTYYADIIERLANGEPTSGKERVELASAIAADYDNRATCMEHLSCYRQHGHTGHCVALVLVSKPAWVRAEVLPTTGAGGPLVFSTAKEFTP